MNKILSYNRISSDFMDGITILCYYSLMSNYPGNGYQQAIKQSPIAPKRRGRTRFTLLMLNVVGLGLLLGFTLVQDQPQPGAEARPVIQIAAPVVNYAPTVGAVSDPLALPLSRTYEGVVGIVAGHKGFDPGAVCPDGLTEAEITANIAQEVSNLLSRRGVQTDLLDEFDDRLTDYQADALVSVHADSCTVPGATGFKVARVTDSAIPEAEDLLVHCLNEEYGKYTGLPQHPSSITDGMTGYHAFREIARQTPGAIIEVGFMLDDRFLLVSKPKIVARGIAAGILCFLDQTDTRFQPVATGQ